MSVPSVAVSPLRAENAAPIIYNNAAHLLGLFDAWGITHTTTHHAPFFKAADRQAVNSAQWAFPVKNFFVYDGKKQFYLITVHLDTPQVDMKALAKQIGAKKAFTFAREEHLGEKLHVLPGSVTPFAICHDDACAITVVLDARLKQSETISAHPLSNDQTSTITTADLLKFYANTGHTPRWEAIPLRTVETQPTNTADVAV